LSISKTLSLVFLVSELALLVLRRSKSRSVKNKKDRSSLLILWIVLPLCITAGFFITDLYHVHHHKHFFKGAGDIIVIAGLIIRWIAIKQLGKAFTVDVSIQQEHHLKTNGLYYFARHPSYTGLLLIIMGLAISMDNWLSLLVVLIPIYLAINYRINVEESVLSKEFGKEYDDYKIRVKKLIPFLY
jgi:protein-S-isoprenylcysteine O-methyltransferase Ste14